MTSESSRASRDSRATIFNLKCARARESVRSPSARSLASHFSVFLEHLQGQRRQQEQQRREQLLDLRLALIIPVIQGNAPAGRHMDTAEHIAEPRWNTIVAELVAFARPVAVDR